MGDLGGGFGQLMWAIGILGAVVGIAGLGVGYVVWRVLQDHWRP